MKRCPDCEAASRLPPARWVKLRSPLRLMVEERPTKVVRVGAELVEAARQMAQGAAPVLPASAWIEITFAGPDGRRRRCALDLRHDTGAGIADAELAAYLRATGTLVTDVWHSASGSAFGLLVEGEDGMRPYIRVQSAHAVDDLRPGDRVRVTGRLRWDHSATEGITARLGITATRLVRLRCNPVTNIVDQPVNLTREMLK